MTTASLSAVPVSGDADGVVVLTLNRPPANALSNALIRELTTALEDLASGPDAPAVVLTGAGSRFFCAGGDLKEAVGYEAESMVERMTSFTRCSAHWKNFTGRWCAR
ncbi:enoyl-CoA hydratase-related protein [Amycolatopsis sp. WGS_07]|uniref:enoyl-CoA hydratase-related protein n=1 Tax=Amycolatopsis sp. WGS_07 TaxID=3076764 RepID=UPI0038735CDD